MPPQFSIIIPAYNEEKYIAKTLHSLKLQTNQDFEVIVVANGCTDKTEEILRKRENSKIRLLSLPNPNVSVARNAGALNAQGNILVFLDADTQLTSDTLHKIKHEFTEQYSVATTKVLPEDNALKFTLAMNAKNFLLTTKLFKGFGGTLICRKDHFQEVQGYDPNLTIKEHHALRKKLEQKGEYRCIDTYTTTSMRRFSQWSFSKTALFWGKQWVRYYQGKELDNEGYERVR